MFASFHSNGTTPSFNDKLNTLASGILICSTVSISNFGGIPSTPGDLLSFIAFIFLATNSAVQRDVVVCLPGAKIEAITERVENIGAK